MNELHEGQVVTDGHGTRGRILRVVKPELSRYATSSIHEEIYVDWGHTGFQEITEGGD